MNAALSPAQNNRAKEDEIDAAIAGIEATEAVRPLTIGEEVEIFRLLCEKAALLNGGRA